MKSKIKRLLFIILISFIIIILISLILDRFIFIKKIKNKEIYLKSYENKNLNFSNLLKLDELNDELDYRDLINSKKNLMVLNLTLDSYNLVNYSFNNDYNLNSTLFKNNKIEIIEYVNYNDKFSKKFHLKIYPKIIEDFEGRIKYVYRQYPNYLDPNSIIASNFVLCAGYQGKFDEVNNYLLNSKINFKKDSIMVISKDLDLNYSEINKCMENKEFASLIFYDIKKANELDIEILPSLEINGNLIEGIKPYFLLKKEIEFQLENYSIK